MTTIEVGKRYRRNVVYGRPIVVRVIGIDEDPDWMNGMPTYWVRDSKGHTYRLFCSDLSELQPGEEPLAPLIGLVGRKRSGKDTVAGMLNAQYGVQRLAFADRLRRVLYGVDPILYSTQWGVHRVSWYVDTFGWEAAKEVAEVRRLLQEIGTVYRNEVDDEAWLRPVIAEALELRRREIPVAITDVRFPNEIDAVRNAGGVVVRIVRPGLLEDAASQHISETALDEAPVDHVIVNDGSLEDLADYVNELGHVVQLDTDLPAAA